MIVSRPWLRSACQALKGVEGGGGVADVDALPVEVEADCFGLAVAEGEGGGGFGRVGEAVQLGEPEGAIAGLDVAEHPAGADGGELLIITDKPDAAAAADDELDGGVQGEGVGHPGFVDDNQAGLADAFRPLGQVIVVDGPGELGQRFGWCTGGVAELRRRGGGRGTDDVAAAVAPRLSQGAHGGGFPAPAGRSPAAAAPEVHMARTRPACPASKLAPFAADSSSASSTVAPSRPRPSVRPAAATSRCSAARIRAEVNRSDPATVYTLEPSTRRSTEGSAIPSSVGSRTPSGRAALGDEQLHQLIDLVGGNLYGPEVALRFSADMPALPGRAPLLYRRQHLLRLHRHPLRIHFRARDRDRIQRLADHGLDRVRSAERFGGLGMPGGALLGRRTGFVFGVPGFQVACCASCTASTGVGGRP